MGKAKPEFDEGTLKSFKQDCHKFWLKFRDAKSNRGKATNAFYKVCRKKYGESGADLAIFFLTLLESTPNFTLNQIGDILMPSAKKTGGDNIDAGMTAGRDINSSAGGVNNKATISGNVTQNIDQSHSVNPNLLKALDSGRKAIDKLKMSEAMKELVKKEYEELVAEVSKPKPEKSTVKKLWENVSHFAGKAAPLVGLGKLIAGMFGLKLAGVETATES